MRKRLTKDQILTIPNAMSLFRLLLIPFIVSAYWHGKIYTAAAIIALSAATDMLDGVVARHFGMVSDLGKVLDPIADKLTQASLVVCLATRNSHILYLLALMLVKETLLLVLGAVTLHRHDTVNSARWHGKLCTVVFETTMLTLILFPQISVQTMNLLVLICAAMMVFSLVMYVLFYIGILRKKS